MKLARYLTSENLTPDQFADALGEVSVSGVRKWLAGERVPRPEQMRRIVDVTKGAVTPNDFFFDEPVAAQTLAGAAL